MMFYNQHIHDKIPYSSASYNLMPKEVMEVVELSITKPFHDLYSFDSRTVRCIGGIKYLVVVISQLPMKRILMDVVVANIPLKHGMLLSKSRTIKIGGTL